MNEIASFFEMDLDSLIQSLFILMSASISGVTLIGKFSEIIGKPVKWVRDKHKDHELTLQNTQAIKELSKRHEEDTRQSMKHDEEIRRDLRELTNMFIDKEINDYRWEIVNLADKIADGNSVSRECYRHAINTYEKYEKIINEHGLVNGEVEISIELIKDSYQQRLKEGFEEN